MFIKFTWHKAKHRGLKYWWYNKDKAIVEFFSYCSNDVVFSSNFIFCRGKMMNVEVSSEATRGILMMTIDFFFQIEFLVVVGFFFLTNWTS